MKTPVKWGNTTEKSSTFKEQLELMDCGRNETYCRYNYVIFCYYNHDFQFYHTICETSLNNTQVKMISVSAIKTNQAVQIDLKWLVNIEGVLHKGLGTPLRFNSESL